MRIRNIKINKWRLFENIELQVGDDIGLVCIVGANGTGKSHLLELIAACAHRLGLSEGVDIPRGDPFGDPHDFSLQFYLAAGTSSAIDSSFARAQNESFGQWDRTLTIQSRNSASGSDMKIVAGGIVDQTTSKAFANSVVQALRQSKDVYFLSLDADRAYPKKNLHVNEVAMAYEIDWAGKEYTRGRSFRTSTMLYDEWIRYFLAKENQAGTRLITEIRRARQTGGTEPAFADHFSCYKGSLQKVIPHLIFAGVDSKKRTLLFDTTGLELTFDNLSGGEREIAFLVGQIDRFGLTQGLFLLDEPELHLNADLIRTWVAYLTGTVATGQVWLATHSLEAVEAAGQFATFVLERNEETRKVSNVARLDTRPVLAALARAVGTPAFSISQLRFVFVEGEEGVGERDSFSRLAGSPEKVRFMECGSCNEVMRRISVIKALAIESSAQIRVGGVIDRDFLSDAKANELCRDLGVYVLPLHEVENFFLHPPTLRLLLQYHGREELAALELIRTASDARAGAWIFQHAMATTNAKSLPDISLAAKNHTKALSWKQFEDNSEAVVLSVVDVSLYGPDDQRKLTSILDISTKAYARKREQDDLWKVCEGKQVLNEVARAAGFAGVSAMVQAAFAAWSRPDFTIPDELKEFRTYLSRL